MREKKEEKGRLQKEEIESSFVNDTEDLEEIDSLKSQIKELKAELEQKEKDRLLILSDAENYRKRIDRENTEIKKYAAVDFIKSMLPSLENLLKGIEAADNPNIKSEDLLNGMKLSVDEIFRQLKMAGLEKVDPLGLAFDPSIAEAVGMVSTGLYEKGEVAEVLLSGYKFKGRLIRDAKVRIEG